MGRAMAELGRDQPFGVGDPNGRTGWRAVVAGWPYETAVRPWRSLRFLAWRRDRYRSGCMLFDGGRISGGAEGSIVIRRRDVGSSNFGGWAECLHYAQH
jgi:hypothetical protein